MINPGVITLATLNNMEYLNFPYRFCIEDNIGEAIHIHYKDIRLDLTTSEFKVLSEKISYVIEEIVECKDFRVKDFDPVFLVAISKLLPNLERIEKREVWLEDILVDTFDEARKPVYKNIKHSRVFKALCGLDAENNNYKVQFNHFESGSAEKLTNQERLLWNLEQIRKNGYPKDGNLITLTEDNKIQDGQHRAACLYYLYGNMKVLVRTLVFKENNEDIPYESSWRKIERELWEQAMQLEASKKVLFQAYFDAGKGYSEENSIKTMFDPEESDIVDVKFPIKKSTLNLRIDPSDRSCCVTILKLEAEKTDGSMIELSIENLSSNAFYIKDKSYFFSTADSQFHFSQTLIKNLVAIHIQFKYESELKMGEKLQRVIESKDNELNKIFNSKSWKITKGLRLLNNAAYYAKENGVMNMLTHTYHCLFNRNQPI